MTKGIIYIAIGEAWVQEAINAASIVRKHMPGIPITVFSDRHFQASSIDSVIVKERDDNPLFTKTQWIRHSPYEDTLCLDTDITLCDSIEDVFMLLNRFDLAVPHAPYRLANMGLPGGLPEFLSSGVPDCFPGMNTGMLLFRNSVKTDKLFDDWNLYHEKLCQIQPKAPQQPAFRTALYHSDLRFAIIPEEYHCRFIFPFKVCGKVKAVHGRHPDIETVISRLNEKTLPRVGEGYFVELGRQQKKPPALNANPSPPLTPTLPVDGIPYGGLISLI